jgi:glycosyltransferase involved in cell wall biosynthesis
MKKYLFIMANEGHRWGGSEWLWSGAAERLAKKGDEVRVSVMDWGQKVSQVEQLRSAGCQIFYRDYSIPRFLTRQVRRLFPAPEYRLAHVRAAGKGMDLVIISQGSNDDGLLWMEATHAAGLKYVIVSQSAVVYWWPSDDFADRLAKMYANALAAYFVARANLELSRWQFSSTLNNAKVVRNPFNVRYDAAVPWPAGTADELVLAFVGRLDIISKGLDLLLQVLERPHWRQRTVRVSLFGHGPHERALRRMATEWKLKHVSFKGESGDIEKVWSEHHALILPSRFEGMPLVMVEAMLCGRPCIATDVGGNGEVIRDGVNGFLAKAATVDFIDEAMNRAWENRHRLEEMGRQAAQDVREKVSADPAEDFARELESQVRSVSKQ